MNSEAAILQSLRSEYDGGTNTEELLASVQELLPLSAKDYKVIKVQGLSSKYVATVECKIEEIDLFITQYMERKSETLRKMSIQTLSEKNSFETVTPYRCHHHTYHQPSMNPVRALKEKPSKRIKNTDCPFRLTLKKKRIPDSFTYLLTVKYDHNHPTKSVQALTFRDIASTAAERIKTLFQLDYTPALAYRECLKQLQSECKDSNEF